MTSRTSVLPCCRSSHRVSLLCTACVAPPAPPVPPISSHLPRASLSSFHTMTFAATGSVTSAATRCRANRSPRPPGARPIRTAAISRRSIFTFTARGCRCGWGWRRSGDPRRLVARRPLQLERRCCRPWRRRAAGAASPPQRGGSSDVAAHAPVRTGFHRVTRCGVTGGLARLRLVESHVSSFARGRCGRTAFTATRPTALRCPARHPPCFEYPCAARRHQHPYLGGSRDRAVA